MSFIRSLLRRSSLLGSLLLAFATCCLAQAPGQQGHIISGSIHDPSDAAIVGANVSLMAPDGTVVANSTSDAAGSYRFEHLKEGTYQVDAQQEGFRETKVTVNVDGKLRVTANLKLPIAVKQEEVNVSGDESAPQVSSDVTQNQNANTVDREALDRLPVFDQDYIATLSRFLDNASLGTNGVSLIVNGIEANGPGVTASAIKTIKINQNPYSALYSRPGRARIEIETKGAATDYHGEFNALFRDAVFDAKNAFATVRPPEQRQYYEGSLSGPLGHSKKTSFLLSLEDDHNDQQAFVLAQGLNGTIQQNVSTPSHHFFGSGRIFHDIGATDQFWIGYSYEQETRLNQGVGGNVLPEAGTNSYNAEHEVNVSYRKVFSPRLVNQIHFLFGHQDTPITSTVEAPAIVVQGAFVGGGAQADGKRTEYHAEGNDIATYVRGNHEWKFGIEIPDWSRRGFDDFGNLQGTYNFASLADYAAGHPAYYLVQRGQGHLVFLEKNVAGIVEDSIRVKPTLQVSVGLRYYFQNFFNDSTTNFAPRFGFAWSLSEKSKTVFRGGAGVFFDRSGPRPIADLLHFNGINLERFIVENPTFPVTPSSLVAQPISLVTLDPRARIPYSVQYGLGVERQITPKSTLSANWVGSRAIDQFRSIDANAPPPPFYIVRPNAAEGQVRQIQSDGYQKSNAMELSFRGRPTRFFTGQAQYTLSKTYNNTSGVTYFPGNSFFPRNDWARADSDQRHRFNLLGTFEAKKLFKLGTALQAYSGVPINITTGNDANHDGITNDRPFGLPRNTLHGPGYVNLDLSLSHEFSLTKGRKEGPSITTQIGAFNVLNHHNNVNYVGVLSSPFFGRAISARTPRQMQLNVQFKF